MYEHRTDPMLPFGKFVLRLLGHILAVGLVILASLSLGIFGYHYWGGLPWLDSVVNAAMILGGMGPVNPIDTVAGKWFAAFYALYSGIVFLAIAGILVAPVAHRLLHHLNLQAEQSGEGD